jgi:benzoyl-CoA-dihydrodiol lyase
LTASAIETGAVDFATAPSSYRHWRLDVAGRIAQLTLAVHESGGLRPGYKLKLNSYDLGVDIELHDALQRIRFEHPSVATVILTGAEGGPFCSGANIYMLGTSSHRWKVNFCKFTNETRNGMEDSSRHDGLRFLAAVNGACAGGGYEIALACDDIVVIDDRSTTISLPEVPLLGVLPGTGGLTRLVDKRRVRRDLADLFCTNADGVRAQRALEWGLADAAAPPSEFGAVVRARAEALAATSPRPHDAAGITLRPLDRSIDADGLHYRHVDVTIDRDGRTATLLVRAPDASTAEDAGSIFASGDTWWPIAFARELDDAILWLRINEPELGLWLLRSEGSIEQMLRVDRVLARLHEHWLVREATGLLRRTLARLEVSSRSLFAIVERGSAFAGTLLETALAADRIYMLATGDDAPQIALTEQNFGAYPTVAEMTRLSAHFSGRGGAMDELRSRIGQPMSAHEAAGAGLVTSVPDEIDWDEELRLAIEERAGLSSDALSGLEANLRFPGAETLWSKIFGRLSAWQNWIFVRPNAAGERGALKVYGSGSRPHFDRERV